MNVIDLDALAGEALDAEARTDLRAAIKRSSRSEEAFVIAGSAGAWNHTRVAGDARLARTDFHAIVLSVLTTPVPVSASLAGPVTGFGMALALAADVRVATPETTLCMGEDAGATALTTGAYRLLANLIGRGPADEITYSGRTLTTADAQSIGLTSEEYSSQEAVADLAESLNTPAAKALKRAATSSLASKLSEQLEYDAWLALSATEESP